MSESNSDGLGDGVVNVDPQCERLEDLQKDEAAPTDEAAEKVANNYAKDEAAVKE